jgi:hypothetical protein
VTILSLLHVNIAVPINFICNITILNISNQQWQKGIVQLLVPFYHLNVGIGIITAKLLQYIL